MKSKINNPLNHLSDREKLEHWGNLIFLLIPLSLSGYVVITKAIQEKEFSMYILLTLGITFLLIRHKIYSPKLIVYKTTMSPAQFKQSNIAAAKLNKWHIIVNKNNLFIATKYAIWLWDGIRIISKLENGKLYVNSMVNLSIRSNPFTFGFNRKNIWNLIHQYQSALKGNNVRQIASNKLKIRKDQFWNESEFLGKNLIMKLIGYPIAIAFIVLGFLMINTDKIEEIVLGVILLSIVMMYLYSDLKVIMAKKRKRTRL